MPRIMSSSGMLTKRWTRSEKCRAWAIAFTNLSMDSSSRHGIISSGLREEDIEIVTLRDAACAGTPGNLVKGKSGREEGCDDTWGFFIAF
jgi:hypothetical protein